MRFTISVTHGAVYWDRIAKIVGGDRGIENQRQPALVNERPDVHSPRADKRVLRMKAWNRSMAAAAFDVE